MNYTDRTAVLNYLLLTAEASFTTQIDEWIAGMSRYMDHYTGRTLVQDTESTQKYDGNGTSELVIDDVHDIAEVTVFSTAVTPYEYPANTSRKNQLQLETNIFSRGKQNVSVRGKFGFYTALPDDLKFACTVLVAGIVNNNNKKTDEVKSEKIGAYSVTYKTDGERADYKRAMAILDMHKRLAF